jgi:hypothetical protein
LSPEFLTTGSISPVKFASLISRPIRTIPRLGIMKMNMTQKKIEISGKTDFYFC